MEAVKLVPKASFISLPIFVRSTSFFRPPQMESQDIVCSRGPSEKSLWAQAGTEEPLFGSRMYSLLSLGLRRSCLLIGVASFTSLLLSPMDLICPFPLIGVIALMEEGKGLNVKAIKLISTASFVSLSIFLCSFCASRTSFFLNPLIWRTNAWTF